MAEGGYDEEQSESLFPLGKIIDVQLRDLIGCDLQYDAHLAQAKELHGMV